MMTFSIEKQARLTALLREELAGLTKLGELTREQARLLTEDDIEAVNVSLDARQVIIEEIDRLHQEAGDLMQSYVSSQSSVAEIDGLHEKLYNTLAEIAKMNDENGAAARARSGEYGKDISKLSLGRKGIGLYNKAMPGGSEYFDKKT